MELRVMLKNEGLVVLHMYRSVQETLFELFSKDRSGKIVTAGGYYKDTVVANRVNGLNVVPRVISLNQPDGALIKPL